MQDLENHTFEKNSGDQSANFTEEQTLKYSQLLHHIQSFVKVKRLLIIKECPFYLLFPRCACIAHHCGAGTIGTGMFSIILTTYSYTILVKFYVSNQIRSPTSTNTSFHGPTFLGSKDV